MRAATDELQPASVTLMERSSGGVDVALVLDGASGFAKVYVAVTVSGQTVTTRVQDSEALDAYWHPFSRYVAPFGGITRHEALEAEAAMHALEAETC